MRRCSVESFGEVTLAHQVHRMCQRVCQLECEHVDKLFFRPGIRLVLFASGMLSLSISLSVPIWAPLTRTPGLLRTSMCRKLCLRRRLFMLLELLRRPSRSPGCSSIVHGPRYGA